VIILLSCGVFADDAEKEKTKYHEQVFDKLAANTSRAKGVYTVAVIHIDIETGDLHEAAGKNVSHNQTIYFPKVDEFTELRNKCTQDLLYVPNVSVRVWMEFPGFEIRSETRLMLYRMTPAGTTTAKYDYLVGSRAIVVNMVDGFVTDLVWDDSCTGCTSDYCLDDGCSTIISKIDPACGGSEILEEDPFYCGMKIYVGWNGTDSEGATLSTYASVPSRFEKYSFFMSAYDAASGFASDFISFWKKPLN